MHKLVNINTVLEYYTLCFIPNYLNLDQMLMFIFILKYNHFYCSFHAYPMLCLDMSCLKDRDIIIKNPS